MLGEGEAKREGRGGGGEDCEPEKAWGAIGAREESYRLYS